jgi:hypothetical protein
MFHRSLADFSIIMKQIDTRSIRRKRRRRKMTVARPIQAFSWGIPEVQEVDTGTKREQLAAGDLRKHALIPPVRRTDSH